MSIIGLVLFILYIGLIVGVSCQIFWQEIQRFFERRKR